MSRSSRDGYFSCKGLCPFSEELRDFFVSKQQLEKFQRNGPSHKFFESLLIGEVVEKPAVIFEGLERDGEDDSLCYSLKPTSKIRKSATIELPFPPSHVMLVFVQVTDKGFTVTWWEKREEDPDNKGYPLNWKEDFTRVKWIH